MRDSDSGFRFLNVLAAGAGGAVHVDTEVGRIDFDRNRVIDFGVHVDRSKGTCVGGRSSRTGSDAAQTVNAGLGAERAVGPVTLNINGASVSIPATSPAVSLVSFTLKPLLSVYFRYMRSSIEAQSWASVPPAPA